MYPFEIFLGIDLYTIFLCTGIIFAVIVFRVLSDKLNLPAKIQNLCILAGAFSVAFGYFSAVFFQGLYNIEKNGGKIIIDANTGATFYGGLIGGGAVFLLIYFVAGARIFRSQEHIKSVFKVLDMASASVCIAHALGRVGCLMEGCCHGKATDSWYGIEMFISGKWQKVVPAQLFEAIFLILLFVYLVFRVLRKKKYCIQIYMCAYGVWRFVIEYLRNDYRGTTFVPAFTPSQLIALLMIIGGAVFLLLQIKLQKGSRNEE